MAEANLTELQQLFDSVEAKQRKRPDMNGDLRLGFASDDFAGTKWKNLTGTAQWSRDGHPQLLAPHQRALGGAQGLPGQAGRGGSLAGPAGAKEQVKMEALRDLADDFNVRDPRKLYRLARHRDLDVTQAMAFTALGRHGPAGAGAPATLWASLLPRARTTGCRPTSSASARTRGGKRSTAWWSWTSSPGRLLWSLCRTRTPKRSAGPPSGWQLAGDDENFVVTTDLGNEFATLDRELPDEAVHRTKRPEDRNAMAVVDQTNSALQDAKAGNKERPI